MKQLFTQDSVNFCRSVRLFSVGSEFHAWFEINVTLRQESNEARLEQDFANYHFVSSFRKRPATRHCIRPSEQRKINYDPRRLNELFERVYNFSDRMTKSFERIPIFLNGCHSRLNG